MRIRGLKFFKLITRIRFAESSLSESEHSLLAMIKHAAALSAFSQENIFRFGNQKCHT